MANSGPIKTYKQCVNYFEQLAMSHEAVHQFQVGELSDVDVQSNVDNPTQYPLVFMIPQISTMDRFGALTLGFSLIVADIAKNQEDLEVNTHNNTLMIMQDLLSKIVLTSETEVSITLQNPVNVVPFVERFNNNLAGWTAEINVVLKSPYNLCAAPFSN